MGQGVLFQLLRIANQTVRISGFDIQGNIVPLDMNFALLNMQQQPVARILNSCFITWNGTWILTFTGGEF